MSTSSPQITVEVGDSGNRYISAPCGCHFTITGASPRTRITWNCPHCRGVYVPLGDGRPEAMNPTVGEDESVPKPCTVDGCRRQYGHLDDHAFNPARQEAIDTILNALNGEDSAISLDRNGDVFDAGMGEYGAVILTNEQLNALADIVLNLT